MYFFFTDFTGLSDVLLFHRFYRTFRCTSFSLILQDFQMYFFFTASFRIRIFCIVFYTSTSMKNEWTTDSRLMQLSK